MVVQTLDLVAGRRGAVGLHVGASNVQQHFPRGLPHVELELDHLLILCRLEPSFWTELPEIHDLRLSSWLESKRNSGKFSAEPAAIAMIPVRHGSFRLKILAHGEHDDLFGTVSVPLASQVKSSPTLLDRRRHESEHTPERRKVVRIRSNASPSANA